MASGEKRGRAALGYGKLNLFGASSGTRAALVYLRRYPETGAYVAHPSRTPRIGCASQRNRCAALQIQCVELRSRNLLSAANALNRAAEICSAHPLR